MVCMSGNVAQEVCPFALSTWCCLCFSFGSGVGLCSCMIGLGSMFGSIVEHVWFVSVDDVFFACKRVA